MNKIFASIIFILHILFLLFMLIAPFTNNISTLILYAVIVPCLWIHWWTNNDICALTLLEKKIRGVSDKNSFMYNLVSPVYKANIDKISHIYLTITWLWVLFRLYRNRKIIKQLFKHIWNKIFKKNKK